MWVLPKPLCNDGFKISLDTFRQSVLWKGKVASEKTWRSRIKNKNPRFLHVNCTTNNPKGLASVAKVLLLATQKKVDNFCGVSNEIFVLWIKGIRTEYNASRKSKVKTWPTPKALEVDESVNQWQKRRQNPSAKMMGPSLTVATKIEQKSWGTPTAFDGQNVERKDLDRLLRHIQSGGRKKRTSSGNLVEQVESTEVEFVYVKVAEYHSQKRSISLKDFIIEALRAKGCLSYFDLPQNRQLEFRGQLNPRWVECLMGIPMGWTNAKLTKTYQFHDEKKKTNVSCVNNWSTPTSSQRGTDLMNYLLKSIRYLKAGKTVFAPSLGQIVEAEHYGINVSELFRAIDLSLDQTTIKQIIRKEYMGL
tara:strand:+ start:2674 stop:3759 length:1086 start_codon:yes stop_codon:yes gene_type:complete